MSVELLGWIGSILFALCGLPQAYKSWKTQSAKDVSWLFLIMWLSGEILTLLYIVFSTRNLPLLFNYIANIMFILIILYVKIKYKE